MATLNLTDEDHLSWRIEYADQQSPPQLWGTRRDDNDKFHFNLGSMSRKPKSWGLELQIALSRLLDTHGRQVALFYSGGSDSEVILRGLLALGVVPEIHTIKFSNDLNSHETQHADALCQQMGITPFIWHHDIDSYIKERKYEELALTYKCTQLAYLTVLEYVRKVNLPVIMGGEIYLQRHQLQDGRVHSSDDWYYIYREDEDGVTYRYSVATGHPVINEVMTYTPELLYSWLVNPIIAATANNEHYGKITLLSMKRQAYEQELGIRLEAKSKFHGYEKLPWTNLSCRNELGAQMPRMKTAKWSYRSLLEHLEGK